MFTEKSSKSNLIIVTKKPGSLCLLTQRRSSVGVFHVFMLANGRVQMLNVRICSLGDPGLQSSQWECTPVTTGVKAWWPPDYQGVRGRPFLREPVATPQTCRLDLTDWAQTLHEQRSRNEHFFHPSRFISCTNCINWDQSCWIISPEAPQTDFCSLCSSPGSFSPAISPRTQQRVTSAHHNQNKDMHKVACVTLNGSEMSWRRQKLSEYTEVAVSCFPANSSQKKRKRFRGLFPKLLCPLGRMLAYSFLWILKVQSFEGAS